MRCQSKQTPILDRNISQPGCEKIASPITVDASASVTVSVVQIRTTILLTEAGALTSVGSLVSRSLGDQLHATPDEAYS
jgi:hypothetical protein